jgi:hypothetical protein
LKDDFEVCYLKFIFKKSFEVRSFEVNFTPTPKK